MTKLLFGCGYLGRRVAKLWQAAGETVCVVTRSVERAAKLSDEGFQVVVADVANADTLKSLPLAETVLFAVGFDRTAGNTIHEVYADGVKNVLAAMPASVERFIYISTTGVYGPAEGDWVDENTPPNPQRDGGKASLAAEQHLGEGYLGEKSIILRLGGIYGPDRVPYLAKLGAGEPIAAPSDGWLNLIHVDDGAAIVLAAEAWATETWAKGQAAGQHTFCVCDGKPVVRGDYYREVARRIGAEPPQFITPEPASPAAARAAASRRISNAKLKQELKYEFAYPSYREGLAGILGTKT